VIRILQKKYKILFLARICVSFGLIAYLIWLVDWNRAITAINGAISFPLFAAPFLFLAGFGFASWRMRIVLADSNVVFSYWQAYFGYLLGSFYSTFLPGVIGGDVVRIGRCSTQTKCQIGTVTASVLLERISGVFALLSMVFLIYLFYPEAMFPLLAVEGTSSVMVVAAIGLLVMMVALLGRRLWLTVFPYEKKTRRKLWSFIRPGIQTLGTLKTRTLGSVLILSVLFQATDIVVTFLLSRALRFNVPLPVFFAIVPLVYLSTVLPISLGGLGVREGTLVFLLGQYGVTTSDAVMLSFLVYLNRLVIGGVGGILQLLENLVNKRADNMIEGVKLPENQK
jgi:uncharacterized protein (TIRG00374 family)